MPARDWIARGVEALTALGGPGMVGGSIDLTFVEPDRLTAAELFEKLKGFPQAAYVESGFAATANMFTTRETVEAVGRFDASLKSCGDAEWGQRARDLGLRQAYAQQVRVDHPARRSLSQLVRKKARVAGGLQQLASRSGETGGQVWLRTLRVLINVRRPLTNLLDSRLKNPIDRLRFAATVELVIYAQALERLRIHYGGTPRRS